MPGFPKLFRQGLPSARAIPVFVGLNSSQSGAVDLAREGSLPVDLAREASLHGSQPGTTQPHWNGPGAQDLSRMFFSRLCTKWDPLRVRFVWTEHQESLDGQRALQKLRGVSFKNKMSEVGMNDEDECIWWNKEILISLRSSIRLPFICFIFHLIGVHAIIIGSFEKRSGS